MEKRLDGDKLLIKFESGEDFLDNLKNAVTDIPAGGFYILMGVGMLKDAEIGYFTGESYDRKKLEIPHEIVALHGSISKKESIVPHVHVGLVGPDHEMVGGHLFAGKVEVVCEAILLKTDVVLGRTVDEGTGLSLLSFH